MLESTTKLIRRGPIMLFTMLIIWLCLGAIESCTKINVPIAIHVKVGYRFPGSTFQTFKIGGNKFETGREGTVYFTPKTFKEAFILETIVNEDFYISLFDLFYLFILDCVFFWMVSDVRPGNVFRLKKFNWISMPTFLVLTLLTKNFFQWYIIDYFTSAISGGYYQALDMHPWNSFLVFTVLFMIPFLEPFFSKARQLETDQNLTI